MVAQRLLARETFKPAGKQLNILAASWIQAMVHDWIGHFDGDKIITLDKGAENGCPFSSFRFKNTKARSDGHFESERSQWWDASFVYGQDEDEVNKARTFKGGAMYASSTPHVLPENKDGSYVLGDNKNSWVGVTLLQDVFLKEHNWIANKMAKEYPDMSDQQIFDATRMVISALVAKVHTVDWTIELLKTDLLTVGMHTNWYGLPKALAAHYINKSALKWFPTSLLAKVGQKKANNNGTPFCLTEEFAAVYRLHSLSPPGLIVGKNENEFIPLLDLVGNKGRESFRKTPERPREIMESCLFYPCGGLYSSNYPNAYRKIPPTTDAGLDLPEKDHIDLAALDLYRDRERGILKFNDFRRSLNLKPYRSWMELTGNNEVDARKLELIYGPGQEGIEKLDLLIGDMYEKKPSPAFALSETSFIIFLLMASRRLDSDPYLNENLKEKYYTEIGINHLHDTDGFVDILDRHYPDLAKVFKDRNQSAFKPLAEKSWEKKIEEVVPKDITDVWAETKVKNEKFFDELEKETMEFTKNIKSNDSTPTSTDTIYILISVLTFVITFGMHQFLYENESLRVLGVRKLFPVDIDVARELGYSNCRHVETIMRIWHLPTNPLIFVSQSYLMDKTPTVGTIPFIKIKLNISGVYFLFLAIYGLMADLKTGAICAAYLYILYRLSIGAGTFSFDDWLTRLVGDNKKLRLAYFMYCFCQFSQIITHNIFENYYDWNLFQLFILQQHVTVYNIIKSIGIFPSFNEEVDYWQPIWEVCKNGLNHAIDCP